jgi:hypothetical protein
MMFITSYFGISFRAIRRLRKAGEKFIGLFLFNRRVSCCVLEFEPHENFGLVEFHGLWDWFVSFWLRRRECSAT